jgi:hypothetical protein
MAIAQDYTSGTVSVSAGGTTVTGVGTAWKTAGIRAGDTFMRDGYVVVVTADATSETSLTIEAWPGSALSGATYRVRFQPDGSRYSAAARELVEDIANGNLPAFAGLVGAADKLAYFTGANTMGLADFPASARALLALTAAADKLPYFTGADTMDVAALTASGRALIALAGAAGQIPVFTGADAAEMRNILGTVSQSSGVPTGAIIEAGSNANGKYARFADGSQICTKRLTGLGPVNLTAGSLFAANLIVAGSWAAVFSEIPEVACSAGANGVATCMTASAMGESTADAGVYQILCTFSSDSTAFQIGIIAVGRWF